MADQAETLRLLVRRAAHFAPFAAAPSAAFPADLPAARRATHRRLWAVTGPRGAGATHVAEMLTIGLGRQAARVALIHAIDLDEVESICENADVAIVDAGPFSELSRSTLLAAEELICVCTPDDEQITGAYAVIKQLWRAGPAPPLHLAVNRAASFEQGIDVWRRLQQTSSRFLGVDVAWLGALPFSNRFVRPAVYSLTDDEAAAIEAMSLRVLGRHHAASRLGVGSAERGRRAAELCK